MQIHTVVKVTGSFQELTDSEIKEHVAASFELEEAAMDIIIERRPEMKAVLCCYYKRRPHRSDYFTVTALSKALQTQVFLACQKEIEVWPNRKR